MQREDHLRKIGRIQRTFDRLDRGADSESVFELAMILGTHWLNVALHEHGSTTPAEDLLHSDKPDLWFSVPHDLADAFARMKQIEDERNRFVRGPEECTAEHSAWCVGQLDEVRRLAGGAHVG